MWTARLRRHPLLTRALFGVDVAPGGGQGHWDLATLALRRALDRHAAPGLRVLEMGCGEAGVLSVHAARRHRASVLATDVDAGALARARETFARNGVAVETRASDLLAAIGPGEVFDLVLFNPPFVPTAFGAAHGLDEAPRVWDGGPDGAAVIRRFLDQAAARPMPGTKILLGFNTRHVAEAAVVAECASRGLVVLDRVAPWWSPAVAVVLATSATSRNPSRGTSG
jgi:methylase of polypeptide subunit release factors